MTGHRWSGAGGHAPRADEVPVGPAVASPPSVTHRQRYVLFGVVTDVSARRVSAVARVRPPVQSHTKVSLFVVEASSRADKGCPKGWVRRSCRMPSQGTTDSRGGLDFEVKQIPSCPSSM